MSKIVDSIAEVCKGVVEEIDKIVIEYMNKKGISYNDIKEKVEIQEEPDKKSYLYEKELILSIEQKLDITNPACGKCEMFITRGNW